MSSQQLLTDSSRDSSSGYFDGIVRQIPHNSQLGKTLTKLLARQLLLKSSALLLCLLLAASFPCLTRAV